MRVLIIGSGGREHALAWKLGQSREKPDILVAPGNGGTAREARNADLPPGGIDRLMEFIRAHKVDFVIPGTELPLVNGIVDACARAGVLCFGPAAYAARLEGSKSFAKEIMREAGVPTADFAVFNDYAAAEKYVRDRKRPLAVKADGLAAGKGVIMAAGAEDAVAALRGMMLEKRFGPAGETVVVEDAIAGEEISLLALCHDETLVLLPAARDHKRALDGDNGPNTGGMGAYSPAPVLPENRMGEIAALAMRPVLKTMKKRGVPYSGVLYAGLMLTADGPKVLEYNVRFGDPECQALLMRFKGDLLELMVDCARGCLSGAPNAVGAQRTPQTDDCARGCLRDEALRPSSTTPPGLAPNDPEASGEGTASRVCSPQWTEETALCVVVAAEGYPGGYRKGMTVGGIEAAEARVPGKIKVFHAGTVAERGEIRASGGRVLGVTALGADLREAQEHAYAAVADIRLEHAFFRRDIGGRVLKAAGSMPGACGFCPERPDAARGEGRPPLADSNGSGT
ncbi:MAG: phosphoribosylamine--glycine ligase [Desulfovibrio sp.]|nr:phosphoribosylamine--glycine ligase [Desulfovibrio sp.]